MVIFTPSVGYHLGRIAAFQRTSMASPVIRDRFGFTSTERRICSAVNYSIWRAVPNMEGLAQADVVHHHITSFRTDDTTDKMKALNTQQGGI